MQIACVSTRYMYLARYEYILYMRVILACLLNILFDISQEGSYVHTDISTMIGT